MRKNINYRNEDNVAAMRAFILDFMVEEDFRNDDEDFILDFFGEQIAREDLTTINSEEIVETYTSLTRGLMFDDEYNTYDYVEESMYINKYYNYELA